MLRRHLILASTFALSWPSMAFNSSSVRPEKSCGGNGGGIVKGGMKNGGGGGNAGNVVGSVVVPDVAPPEVVVVVVVDEGVVIVVPLKREHWNLKPCLIKALLQGLFFLYAY